MIKHPHMTVDRNRSPLGFWMKVLYM